MEDYGIWAVLVRMSTNSSMIIKTPFKASEFTGSQADQLDAGAWCLDQMGGSWVPALFVLGSFREAEKMSEELVRKDQK